MTRQRRPAVGGGSAEVVSIGIGGTHHPDYARLASGQVAAARRELGLSLKDFARLVYDQTGWDMLPEGIAAWEDDELPPGDVVYACMAATRGPVAASLLSGVPPAFPADVLTGYWVTSYQFTHAGRPHHHADIASVTAVSDSRIQAVNHPPAPRTEGRPSPFRNVIEADLAHRHLVGHWKNTSDSRYFGSLELAVLPGETVMQGVYTGVASDIEVSMSAWRWVRLDPDSTANADVAAVVLRDPAEVYELVQSHSQYGGPLLLAEIREGA